MAHQRAGKDWQITRVEVGADDRRNPTWSEVRSAIGSLDAGRRSDLVIEAADGSLLVIGGGRGRFHVQFTYPRGAEPEILSLANPSRGTELEDLIVGGVGTPLPARLIVDEVKASQAARRFYEDGVADPALTWEAG